MSEPSEQQLLQAWAEHRDEAAFGALVRRYAGFVFGAAARRVGDACLAEEIAQDVFARLAHHARSLAAHPTLAGWLHRATMLLALDRLRRRARHERKLAQYASLDMSTPPPDSWSAALPHLDEALDHLGSRDREVLMLYFAERLPYSEIARRLGLTSDAWRMRVSRALAALAGMLRKKGFVVPVALLTSGLTGAFAQAAPAVVAGLTASALTGCGKAKLLSVIIHTMQTTKTAKLAAVAALFILLPAMLVIQQIQISALETSIATHREFLSSRGLAASPNDSLEDGKNRAVGPAGPLTFKQLGELALEANGTTRINRFAHRQILRHVEHLDNNNLAGLIDTIIHVGMLPEPREKLLEILLAELRTRDVGQYVDSYLKTLAATEPNASLGGALGKNLSMGADAAFRDWVAKDPTAATQWAATHSEEWSRLQGTSLQTLNLAGLLLVDNQKAFEMMQKLSTEDCVSVLKFAANFGANLRVEPLATWAASLADTNRRRDLVTAAFRAIRTDSKESALKEAGPILSRLAMLEGDRRWVAVHLAVNAEPVVEKSFSNTCEMQFAWLGGVLGGNDLSYAKGAVLGHRENPQLAFNYLSENLAEHGDDDLIAGYVEGRTSTWKKAGLVRDSGCPYFGEIGFKLATQVSSPARRIALLTTAWTELNRESSKEASAILDIPELTAADRAELLMRISPKN